MKLLPLLAISMAMKFTSLDLWNKYYDFIDNMKKDNFDSVELMHHLSAGYKSLFTQRTMDGLMLIRQCIGGAGYTAWSGIPLLIQDFAPAVSYEGDNTVLAQQSFRYLQKLYKLARSNLKVAKEFEYLTKIDQTLKLQCKATTPEEFCCVEQVSEALEACTAAVVHNTMQTILKSKASNKEILNHLYGNEIVTCSLTHLKYLMFSKFKENISILKEEKLRVHLYNLCSLAGLTFLQECMTAGYDSGYFKRGDQQVIQKGITLILKKIRPQAIPLIELANHSDHTLTSAIGNSYGDIYETYFEWSKNSRLNDQKDNIPPHFHEYLGPILQGKL